MPDQLRTVTIRPPIGGVVRRHDYQSQEPYTSPSATNVWPTDWSSGRERVGTRPGLTAAGSIDVGTPYSACTVDFDDGGGNKRGAAVTHSSGTELITHNGTSFTNTTQITTAPGSDFSSCTTLMGKLFQTSYSGTLRGIALSGGGGAGTNHTNAPDKCGLVCGHGSRLWLAGDADAPQILYASRIGGDTSTPGDFNTADAWDFAATDASAAFANSGSSGGKINGPITGLLTHTEDCLLVGLADGIYVVRGNPTAGGQIAQISLEVGPLMQSAWCHDSRGYCYILTRDGLYRMAPGCGDAVESVSRESLPDELVAISPALGDHVSCCYDHRWRGIHIYVDRASGSDSHWFYDLQSGGFWEMTFASTLRLACEVRPAMTTEKSSLVAFDATGLAYQFDRGSSESYTSTLWLGPLMLGKEGTVGILHSISATLSAVSASTDEISWEVFVGNSPIEAFNSTAFFTGDDWTSENSFNFWQTPRARGAAAYIKLSGTTTDRWSWESIVCRIQASTSLQRVS